MKKTLSSAGFLAGLGYGAFAIAKVYSGSPPTLQAGILFGVAAVGAGAGWLLGCVTDATSGK